MLMAQGDPALHSWAAAEKAKLSRACIIQGGADPEFPHWYECPVAARAKYHKPDGLKRQKCVLSQRWRPEVPDQCEQGLAPSGGWRGASSPASSNRRWLQASPDLWPHHSILHLHILSPSVCVFAPCPGLKSPCLCPPKIHMSKS